MAVVKDENGRIMRLVKVVSSNIILYMVEEARNCLLNQHMVDVLVLSIEESGWQ